MASGDIWSFTLNEDIEKVQELLQDGVSVDSKNDLGETPLLLAASRGLERIAEVFAHIPFMEAPHSCTRYFHVVVVWRTLRLRFKGSEVTHKLFRYFVISEDISPSTVRN